MKPVLQIAGIYLLMLSVVAAGSYTVTVTDAVSGYTPDYIGGNEGGAFSTNHLQDSGINLYRIWATMGELEYYDDNWAADGYPGWPTYPASNYYGKPMIEEIRTNAAAIPWDIWDDAFTRDRWTLAVPFKTLLDGCKSQGVEPLLVLRTIGPGESWIDWIPTAPDGTNFWHEWWAYCFTVAYWCNVSNDYEITHFQVHNEPDLGSQGWTGTQSDYVQLVNYAHDALTEANDLAGLPVYVHAPVSAGYNSSYVSYTLNNTDTNVDVVDYHVYDQFASVATSISTIKATVTNNNPDAVVEPVWITEWGSLGKNYDTLQRGLKTAENLFDMAEGGIEGSAIFMLYDWGGDETGLINTNLSEIYESYYAFRLMTRALINGKEKLAVTNSDASQRMMVLRDTNGVYVVALTNNADAAVDLSAIGYGRAYAVLSEYSATAGDSIVGTNRMDNGLLVFNCASQALISAFIPAYQLDTDSDDIWDGWERAYFTNLDVASRSADYDGDIFTDFSEFITGTAPNDSNSYLKVMDLQYTPSSNIVLTWSSESGVVYAVEGASDLMGGFTGITNLLPATYPVNSCTSPAGSAEESYYRIRVDY